MKVTKNHNLQNFNKKDSSFNRQDEYRRSDREYYLFGSGIKDLGVESWKDDTGQERELKWTMLVEKCWGEGVNGVVSSIKIF